MRGTIKEVIVPEMCCKARKLTGKIQIVQLLLPQPNSTQPRVGLALFSYAKPHHKPQNRIPLYLSSYTTKLDQIQYATLFQPN